MSEEESKNFEYKETIISKWVFRVIAIVGIMVFLYVIVRLEFRELAENDKARKDATTMIGDIARSFESLQDAWNTMYFFYQTGDLMKIMKCPMASNKSSVNQKNTLLMLYREELESQKSAPTEDITTAFRDVKNIRCGGKITIDIGLKDEIHLHPKETKRYVFNLGSEPVELLETYPFVKDALSRLRFGEKATFVSLPAEKKTFAPKKQTIYEMSIPKLANTEITNVPLYMPVGKNDEKFEVDNHVVCGSVAQILFTIQDINGNELMSSDKNIKVKVGSGELNDDLEQIMTQMRVGDRYKILLTKYMFKPTEILNKNIFESEDIVFVDLIVVDVKR